MTNYFVSIDNLLLKCHLTWTKSCGDVFAHSNTVIIIAVAINNQFSSLSVIYDIASYCQQHAPLIMCDILCRWL